LRFSNHQSALCLFSSRCQAGTNRNISLFLYRPRRSQEGRTQSRRRNHGHWVIVHGLFGLVSHQTEHINRLGRSNSALGGTLPVSKNHVVRPPEEATHRTTTLF
jgi:hypothetical protein